MTQSIKDQFISFLKKHDAYVGFMTQYQEENEQKLEEYLVEEDVGAITGAFFWSDAVESADYWSDIDDKWQAHLKGEE